MHMKFNESVHYFCSFVDDEYTYFPSADYNALLRCKQNYEFELFDVFKGDKVSQQNMFTQIVPVEKGQLFIPYKSRGVYIFDKEKKAIQLINTLDNEMTGFSQAYRITGGYILIPNIISQGFYKYDDQCNNISYIPQLSEKMNTIQTNRETNWIDALGSCRVDVHTIAVALAETNTIALINIEKNDVKTICINGLNLGNIYWNDGKIWAVDWSINKVISYDLETEKLKKYIIEEDGNGERPFYGFASKDDQLFLFPCKGKWIWKYDKVGDCWIKYLNPYDLSGFERELPNTLFFGWEIKEDEIAFYPRSGNGLLSVNLKNKSINLRSMKISEALLEKIRRSCQEEENLLVDKAIENYGILNEDVYDLTISKYIDYVRNR